MESPGNCDLLADVIEEILLRLPVTTLLRFKCVCKHWYSVIGSPSFVKRHFGHESNQKRLLTVRDYRPNEDRYAFALYVDEMFSGYEEPDHLQMPGIHASLHGPLNGVFCAVNELGRMALLNPAMRQFKPLPPHNVNVDLTRSVYDYVIGFGLDPLSGDYKIVYIQYALKTEMNVPVNSPLVTIYNSGSDSWRHLEHVDLLNSMHYAYGSVCNTCLNGVYYWLMNLKEDTGVAILAFDMSSEHFHEIQVPDCIKSEEGALDLVLCGDSIALLSYDPRNPSIRIGVWVMKNEGCWAKTSTLGPFEDFIEPLGFWKNTELLFDTGGYSLLNLCDISTQTLRTIKARGRKTSRWGYWVFSYKESLVSIKRERDNCKLWDTSSDFVMDFFR